MTVLYTLYHILAHTRGRSPFLFKFKQAQQLIFFAMIKPNSQIQLIFIIQIKRSSATTV